MAQLTITVPDAVITRIQQAFGSTNPTDGTRIPASINTIQDSIKSYIKSTVLEYETSLAAIAKRAQVGGESW